ncbi:solute carrier family 22 member 13-like isoform X2 [Montipora capricornis]|uniref:solute carrier family 22 member 13-like isoform X2 n=1 Tax=Montipora capricornis TaxID=246305 RepID=UPI0035F181D5
MAFLLPVDSFFATLSGLNKTLYRNISLLALILFILTYQSIIVEFLIEKQISGACNETASCLVVISGGDNSSNKAKVYPGDLRLTFGITQYLSVLLGALVLATMADAFGRLKSLFASLVITFIGGLASAFAFNSMTAFTIFRGIAGFGIGSAYPMVFILAAEYVNSKHRSAVLFILWASSTLAFMSLAGIACVVEKRRMLMLTLTLPLLVAAVLCKVLSESPRWVLLYSAPSDDTSEAKRLLERNVSDVERRTPQYRYCLTLFGRFYSASDGGIHGRCFIFLRLKEPRRITIVLGFAWFALGLILQGLNTTSIQLFKTFYANFAIRELVSLLGFCAFLILATWVGRRLSTVVSMSLAGVSCLLFSIASDGFLRKEQEAVVVVIQLIGRLCVMVALASLSLYSIELYPTKVRCSAVGLVTSFGYLGVAICPLIMRIELLAHAVVPLGVMGCLCLTAGLLCHFLLPKTQDSTAEDFDGSSQMTRTQGCVPRVHWTKRKTSKIGHDRVEMVDSCTINDLDCVSRTSRWEMLSQEDARERSVYSFGEDASLDEESNLLSEEDVDKLASHVPSCTWILAYSTFQHGMSLSTLYNRLREVETPVLMVVKDNSGFIFGVFSPAPPGLQPHFCGFGKSFFFTCKPQFKIYPCSGKNSYYMTGDSSGLAFGCSEGTFGLWLDNELYHGRSTACDTYNSEMLSATEDFTCLGVEVWTFA